MQTPNLPAIRALRPAPVAALSVLGAPDSVSAYPPDLQCDKSDQDGWQYLPVEILHKDGAPPTTPVMSGGLIRLPT